MTNYPEDEFDVLARNRGPKGVHREVESPWRRLAPYLLVLVAAPFLAWGVVSLLNQDGDSTAPVATGSPAASDAAAPTGETPSEAGSPAEEPEATEEATPAEPEATQPEVDYAAPVLVLNGARVAGIAARTADRLVDAGFSAVTTGNYAAAQPASTTVYYDNAALAPTAQAVAQALGIDTLVELASATDSITVVLRRDFEG